MTHTLGRLTGPAAALVLLTSGLAGCGLLDGRSRLEEALEYLPADAVTLTFVDRAAMAERVGVDDLATGASEKDLDRWIEAMKDEAYGTELSPWLAPMQDAAFSDLDVEWEASGLRDSGPRVLVWKLSDDVDFDALAEDLEDAGYRSEKDGDAVVLQADLSDADPQTSLIGGRYPSRFTTLALVPGEHLVLSGDVEGAVAVADDDKDSLADAGSFGDLLDRADTDDLEYARASVEPLCGGVRLSADQSEQAFGDLGTPDATGLFVRPEEDLLGVRLFDDGDAAEKDAAGLEGYLEGEAERTGFDVGVEVEADGDTVRTTSDWDDRRTVIIASGRGEGPFACKPASRD